MLLDESVLDEMLLSLKKELFLTSLSENLIFFLMSQIKNTIFTLF